MKYLLCLLALLTAIAPLRANLGIQQSGSLTVATLQGCGDVDPASGRLIAPPRCLFVSVKTDRSDADRFLITITYEDPEGQHQFQFRSVAREDLYSTVAFQDLLGVNLKTVEIEQFSNGASVDWSGFDLN
jgi:hypothetical protein